ncbi:MAG: CHAT domain-containing protein [Cyanobacteria bacterium J06635_10]
MKKIKYLIIILLISLFIITLSPVLATPIFVSYSQTQSLIEQGKRLYEIGRFTEAVNLLKQAVDKYQADGDQLNEAITLSNLSLAYKKLGEWQSARKTINRSLNLLKIFPKNKVRKVYAQSLDIKGNLEFAQGQFQKAIVTWKDASKIYSQLNLQPALIQSRINQAQAMQALGLFLQAQKTLTELQEILNKQPDNVLKSIGLRSVGDVLRTVGNLDESRKILQQSLKIASKVKADREISETLISLGNTVRFQQEPDSQISAIKYYQQAADIASSKSDLRILAQLNLFSLLVEIEKLTAAKELIPQISAEIANLLPSRFAVDTQINFAKTLEKFKQKTTIKTPSWLDIAQILSTAIRTATTIKDKRAESYALGNLGELYEQTKQLNEAQKLTSRALALANSIGAREITYQLQWQMGRLYRQQGNIKAAIESYHRAWQILKSLRSDLVAVDSNLQFSFRESIEPVYRQYVDLILKTVENDGNNKQKLIVAREVIESLQLAEIDNFFRSACFNTKVILDEVVDKDNLKAAIVYPIILPDRLEVILKLPHSELISYTTRISKKEVEETIKKLRTDIEERKIGGDDRAQFQKLYNWLLQPAGKYLENNNINTLVFVLDGSLRNIPPGVLYDGKQYLIEKYSIAVSPGLQLYELQPIKRKNLHVLMAGLSEKRFNFSKLDYVEEELQQIKSEVSDAKVLLNQEFTSNALEKQVLRKSYPIVHLATHGQFSSSLDETFLLAYDQPIKVNQLNQWLRNREENRPEAIELLVLSACETATGDKRAALGLAGVAIQAGARSTVASLWALNDASTAQLMSQFYQELKKPGVSKAEALRNAQLTLLKQEEYSIPYFWAPYVLIGNWL